MLRPRAASARRFRFSVVLLATCVPPLLGDTPRNGGPRSDTTEDPARWWTLTDELTPDQLRAIHEDVERHRERYREAIGNGYRPMIQTAGPDTPDRVRSFYDGALNPELVPMWLAFDAFGYRFYGEARRSYLEAAPAVLARYGLEGEPAQKTLLHALRFLDETEALIGRLRGDQLAFVEILREAGAKLDRATYRKAVDGRDAGLLARATGRDPALVERLLRVWLRDPVVERAVAALPALKRDLGAAGWDRFRRFLFREIAPGIAVLDFDDDQ